MHTGFHTHNQPHAVAMPLNGTLSDRVRRHALPTLFWALIGALPGTIWTLLQSTLLMSQLGIGTWILRCVLISFSSAFIMGFVFSISAVTGTNLARRPARFIAALTLGATCALAMLWLTDALIPITVRRTLPHRILDWWLTLMLFGAVFGWAGVLFLQRLEDRNRLASLLARHSLLTRQITQSRLLATRARIEPEMVARVLRSVRGRYGVSAPDAALLLDQLIGYLRLAMGRASGQHSSLHAEFALLRAYHSLRSTETAKPIDLHVDFDEQPPVQAAATPIPLFLIGKQLIDEALCLPEAQAKLHLCIRGDQMRLALETGAVVIPADRQAEVFAHLHELAAGTAGLDILHLFSEPGVNRYVVQAALR